MSSPGACCGLPSTGEPDDEFSREVIDQFLDSVISPPLVPYELADTAVPSDAFTLFLEIVRQHIPKDKQELLIASRGAASIQAALSVEYVCGLALEEIRARVVYGYRDR
jgi:hypothetical protein